MQQELWQALSWKLPVNAWRAAFNPDGDIASCHTAQDNDSGKIVIQKIISNAWIVQIPTTNSHTSTTLANSSPDREVVDIIPQYTQDALEKMQGADLKAICRQWNLRAGTRKQAAIDSIHARWQLYINILML
jgi:hypothetical protein